ncbi:hypothetical protein [Massilia sp. TSP1-1-2]|uniref:hypothetical protein n=1 Tax=Massilia sp. TSP1-1-2 TaxID=2804649 RepID=UPI003CF3BCCD
MHKLPDTAHCRTTLADGSIATVTATRRPRAVRADVKCSPAQVAERMQQVVRLARHTEPRVDSRDQVVISIDRAPGRDERDWELAVVLADRMVRAVWQGAGQVHANGWSDQWELGRIGGHDSAAAGAIVGGPTGLAHLGALSGQPDCGASVSAARAWFPLHSGGINDCLCRVEVSVYPLSGAAGEEEDSIATPGLDLAAQLAVRQVLAGARHFDGRGLGRWRTVVRFAQPRFQGNSFELALVMADRMARGREFVPRGRVIASGSSGAWHAGQVDAVEGCAPKCALIEREAVSGDRILLPKAWEASAAPEFAGALHERGASVAWIDRIGII